MTAADVPPMRQHLRDPLPTARAVWLGVVAAPLAWSLQLGIGWWISGVACADGTGDLGPLRAGGVRLLQLAIGVAALLVSLGGIASALRAWRDSSVEPTRLSAIRGERRVGFMAASGVLISALIMYGIVLTAVANTVVSICEFTR